jgi:hypothetical protein
MQPTVQSTSPTEIPNNKWQKFMSLDIKGKISMLEKEKNSE